MRSPRSVMVMKLSFAHLHMSTVPPENSVHRMPMWRKAALIAILGTLVSCSTEKGAVDLLVPTDDALGVVTVSPDAVILAVGETRQLTVNATALTGAALTDFDTVS